MSEKLITTRNRVVAKQSRCEGVYNRTGDLSVICFGEEEQRNECEAIKNRRKRYVACDDVAGVAGFDKASLVACNNFMSLLLRKRWTNRFESCRKAKQKNNRHSFVSVIFWLGWQDSNLRMQQSKCCVLPLDDTPILSLLFILIIPKYSNIIKHFNIPKYSNIPKSYLIVKTPPNLIDRRS